jgi:hypothetical protein
VRRSDMASLTRRPGDLTSETQHFEEEESNPVWAFAQLRRLGVRLVTVSHANLVGLIRIPRPSTHPYKRYWRTVLAALFFGSLQGDPIRQSDLGDRTLHRPRYRSEHGQREPPRQVPTKLFGAAHFDFTRTKCIGPP